MSHADNHKRLSHQHHSCSQEGAAQVICRKELVPMAVRWHLNIYIYNKGLFPLELSVPSISTLPCKVRKKCPLWFCILSSLKNDHRLLAHRYIYLIHVRIKPLLSKIILTQVSHLTSNFWDSGSVSTSGNHTRMIWTRRSLLQVPHVTKGFSGKKEQLL